MKRSARRTSHRRCADFNVKPIDWKSYGFKARIKIRKDLIVNVYVFQSLDKMWGWQVTPVNQLYALVNGSCKSEAAAKKAVSNVVRTLAKETR